MSNLGTLSPIYCLLVHSVTFPIASNDNIKLQRVSLHLTLLFPCSSCEWVSQAKGTGFSCRCKHFCGFLHFSFNSPPVPQVQLFVPHTSQMTAVSRLSFHKIVFSCSTISNYAKKNPKQNKNSVFFLKCAYLGRN